MKRKAGDAEERLLGSAPREKAGHAGASAQAVGVGAEPAESSQAEGPLRAYLRVLALKRLYRQGWLKRGLSEAACESVADHSFGTAILALFLAGRPPYETANRDKAVMMALAHELCEVYAGDLTPDDGLGPAEKRKLERDSLLGVLEGLPDGGRLLGLWEEFEEGTSPEARLVKQLDRLEMGIQAAVYRAEGAPGMEEFLESARFALKDGLLAEILSLAEGKT